MRNITLHSWLAGVGLALAACSPSPAEVTQKVNSAIAAKDAEGALALVAPEAANELRPVVQDLIAKNTKLDLVGQYKIEGNQVTGLNNVTNDEYTKLGVAPLAINLEAAAVKGKLTAFKLSLTPESQAKVDGAMASLAKKAVDDYEAAVNSKKIDAVLALLTDNATVTDVDGKTYQGADLKAHYEQMLAQNTTFTTDNRNVAGGKVSYVTKLSTDDWTKANVAPLAAAAEAVVANGKIASLTLTLTPEAAAKLAELTATAAAPAPAKKGGKK